MSSIFSLFKGKLAKRTVVILALFFVLPLVIFSSILSSLIERQLEDQALDKLAIINNLKSNFVNSWINSRVEEIKGISEEELVKRSLEEYARDPARRAGLAFEIQNHLNKTGALYRRHFFKISILNPTTGAVIASTDQKIVGKKTENEALLNRTLQLDTTEYVALESAGMTAGEGNTLELSAPVRKRGAISIIGIVNATVTLVDIDSTVNRKSAFVKSEHSYVMDKNGSQISPRFIPNYADQKNMTDLMNAKVLKASDTAARDKDTLLVAYNRIPLPNWLLVTEIQKSEVIAGVSGGISKFMIAIMLAIIFIFLLVLRIINQPIKKTIDVLGESTLEISGSLEKLYAESNKSSAIAKKVAEGAKEQSQQSEVASEQVANITDSVEHIAKNTKEVSEIAVDTSSHFRQIEKAAEKSKASLIKIKEDMSRIAEMIKNISNQSGSVNEILKSIAAIANRTHILSLNASLEAVKVGEAGEGFAVVADEIKKLADESAKNAESVSKIVGAIKKQIDDTNTSTEEISVEVDEGSNVIIDVLSSLKTVAGSVEGLSSRIQEISAASVQQFSSSETITKKISSISSIIEENSTDAQTLSESTEKQFNASKRLRESTEKLEELSQELTGLFSTTTFKK